MKKLLLFYLIIPIYLSAQKDPLYKVYNTADKKEITLDQLIKEISLAQVVFFGEEHNDSVAHVLQLEVFKGLHNIHGKKISLSMEMFQTDVQLVLNEYLAGQITEKNLLVDARPWQNYKDYRPLVEYAKSKGIYVLAANAPSRYTNRVTRHGVQSLKELSTEGKKLIAPLPIDTLTGRYYEKFVGLLGGHAGMGNMKIYQSQNVWDATMASKIAKLAKKRSIKQVLHLNGRFHTDEKLGTYTQLQRYGRKLKLINISSFGHDNLDAPNWAAWEHLGDYVILTASSVQKTF